MITFFITFLAQRTMKFAKRDDPFFSMTLLPSDYEVVDLWNLDFYFAIEDLDPRIGKIRAYQVFYNITGENLQINRTEINLIDCKENIKDNGTHKNVEMGEKKKLIIEHGASFLNKPLCPADLD